MSQGASAGTDAAGARDQWDRRALEDDPALQREAAVRNKR